MARTERNNLQIFVDYIFTDDAVTPQEKNSGFMNALLEVGGVRSMFVGHDHGNFSLNINTQILD